MNQKQRQAYEWAKNQNYPSVAARYAKILAGLVDEITPPNEPHAGLYGKYTVYKNEDGSLVTDCFILRPTKDPAAVAALRAYAAATDNAELAADIINWVGAEPNEPLSIEQLREMDGEPVWVDDEKTYAILQVWDDDNIDAIFSKPRGCIHAKYAIGMKIYRRPPEGAVDT